jgi:nucleotide-binding universal stress UspA family protein
MRSSPAQYKWFSTSERASWRTRWPLPERLGPNHDACRVAPFAHCVLVPTDFSESSRTALAYAMSLVERCQASLHLLHVLQEVVGAEPLEWHMPVRTGIERTVEESAWADLQGLLSDEDHARLKVQLAIEWGRPAEEILRYTRTHQVDLVAMGRNGRSGINQLLMGRVTERIVREAPCAVLSVRPVSHP